MNNRINPVVNTRSKTRPNSPLSSETTSSLSSKQHSIREPRLPQDASGDRRPPPQIWHPSRGVRVARRGTSTHRCPLHDAHPKGALHFTRRVRTSREHVHSHAEAHD